MFPQKLLEIRDFLATSAIQLSNNFQDGRINSSFNEQELIELIGINFDIEKPPARYWYDFAIPDGKEKIPVNIKVTSTTTADNLQCKLGIYFALTGQWPDFPNEIPWNQFFNLLKCNLSTNKEKDYYFLIINKRDPSDIFCNSLKKIDTLVPNGNNLPFQCNWGNNRIPKQRTHDEAVRFILGTFYKSIKLRSEILREFEENFRKIL